ncbi:unnamed protein product [Lymnaea stagnalis]|uniref:Uncharacterized protein n=1 Tax=Lymnaea stagnalis TaxID=6523 RepID=A0AAV2I683_LYMST
MPGLATWIAVLFSPCLQDVVAQTHLGVIDVLAGLTCYSCDGRGQLFPACLRAPVVCQFGEVCSVIYGNANPVIGCKKVEECSRDVSHPMGSCTGGGVAITADTCELCCHTATCVNSITAGLELEFGTASPLTNALTQTTTAASHVITTTTATSSNQSMATTTRQLPTQHVGDQVSIPPMGTINCTVCYGGNCQSRPFTTTCESGFCVKTLQSYDDGQILITKGCGSLEICRTGWWLETRTNPSCMSQLKSTVNPTQPMSCYFCCASGHNCNDRLVDAGSLYHFQ